MSNKNKITIQHGALVCDESKLRGEITIGANSIIHPSAVIYAESGPIIIGDHCIIEEKAKIIHRVPFDRADKTTTPALIIGSNNVFEVDCTVEACQIGDNNVFEPKCFVGSKVTISDGCVIGAGCSVTEEEIIPKNTVIYGGNHMRREAFDKPAVQHGQMETLKKVLPGYHRLKKPTEPPPQ
ncbi:dynactin subunit 6 [Atheta coriaria]|uniref:dynactin subunit 6 n=1 Tax=Dalotia coriaria TaxID=877792 RepID=UPI0031F35770